jgi:hypothetical protein
VGHEDGAFGAAADMQSGAWASWALEAAVARAVGSAQGVAAVMLPEYREATRRTTRARPPPRITPSSQ